MSEEFLIIEASVKKAGNPKVAGLAYGGGKINLGWQEAVVVDLAGLAIPANVPLLANHENRTASRVGQVAAKLEGGTLVIDGEITASSGPAHGIVEQAGKGAQWQLSIGAEVREMELVKSGNREINGQTHQSPFYHVKQSTLREVSVVAVGADAQTRLEVAAKFNLTGDILNEKDKIMGDEKSNTEVEASKEIENPEPEIKAAAPQLETKPDPVQIERQRVSAIAEFSRGDYPEIEAQAIREGWTFEQAAKAMREKFIAAKAPESVGVIIKSQPEGETGQKVLTAALSLRAGVSGDELQSEYGDEIINYADKRRGLSLMEMMRECVRLEGSAAAEGDTGLIRAAFSTVSLPGILSNVANKRMLKAFTSQSLIAPKLCSEGDLNDFKENQRFRLTDVGDLQPVAADGEIKDGGVREDKATNQLDTYGKKFVLTRKMIVNDDLGAFMKFPASMGNRAARLVDQLFFKRLLANPTQGDNKKLFHTAHKNLLSGNDSGLSVDSLTAAVAMYLDQVDADGQPISVEPKYLLVPTALKHTAITLTRGAQLIMAGGDSTNGAAAQLMPALNALADENLQVISSPYLSNANYSGSSELAWYLFGDPAQVDTFEIGHLKGKRTPTIEKGTTDFNTLGMWFRVFFDIGVREQDHRGMLKSVGE